jgi:hypothetical protein
MPHVSKRTTRGSGQATCASSETGILPPYCDPGRRVGSSTRHDLILHTLAQTRSLFDTLEEHNLASEALWCLAYYHQRLGLLDVAQFFYLQVLRKYPHTAAALRVTSGAELAPEESRPTRPQSGKRLPCAYSAELPARSGISSVITGKAHRNQDR